MQRKYLSEITAMLLVGGSAFMLIHLDSYGILSCLPLLVGLYAIHRGASWAAFAVLAGATGLLTLTIAGRAPWLLSIGAGSAVIPTLIALPSLWRFDRLATQVLTGLALVLGIAGALLSSSGGGPVPAAEEAGVELPVALESESGPVAYYRQADPTAKRMTPAPCVAADLVGIYSLPGHRSGSLRLGADRGFVYDLGDGARRSGTFAIDEHGVVLTGIDEQVERIGCGLEKNGRFTLDGHAVWEVAR